MKTVIFTGRTRDEANTKLKASRATNTGILEIRCIFTEHGTASGRFAPKSEARDMIVTVSLDYE